MTHSPNDWHSKAERLTRAGNPKKAEQVLLQFIQGHPDDVAPRLYLARSYLQAGQVAASVPLLEQAIQLAQDNPEAYLLLGYAAIAAGQWQSAAEFLLKALSLDPNRAEAHYHLGLAAQQMGQLQEASLCYDSALALQPDFAEAHNNLGAVLLKLGQPDKAEQHFREALRLNPSLTQAATNLEQHYLGLQRFAEACELLHEQLRQHPTDLRLRLKAAAAGVLGGDERALDELQQQLRSVLPLGSDGRKLKAARLSTGELKLIGYACRQAAARRGAAAADAAVQCYWAAAVIADLIGDNTMHESALQDLVALRDFAPAWAELGHAAFNRQAFELAERYYRSALQTDPSHADSLNGLGAIYMRGRARPQPFDAIPLLERAIKASPSHGPALSNLGLAYLRTGHPDAISVLRRAARLAPRDADAHNNLALALLARGKLKEGWKEYEWRLRTSLHRPRPFGWLQWSGESLTGRTLLVHGEQGLGDEVLFASCLPDLLKLGADCIVECDPRLVPLFARSFAGAKVVPRRSYALAPPIDELPEPDYQIPMGSLPGRFRRSISDFPDRQAFLRPDPVRVEFWRKRLDALGPGPKVGVSWRSGVQGFGRPTYPPITEWHGLFAYFPDCHFIDLQYDDSAGEHEQLRKAAGTTPVRFPDLDTRNDLDELAALLRALDLVITVPNINAPLAGALGVPTWRLFSFQNRDPMRLGADHYPWFPTITSVDTGPSLATLFQLFGAWREGLQNTCPASSEPTISPAVHAAQQGLFAQALVLLDDLDGTPAKSLRRCLSELVQVTPSPAEQDDGQPFPWLSLTRHLAALTGKNGDALADAVESRLLPELAEVPSVQLPALEPVAHRLLQSGRFQPAMAIVERLLPAAPESPGLRGMHARAAWGLGLAEVAWESEQRLAELSEAIPPRQADLAARSFLAPPGWARTLWLIGACDLLGRSEAGVEFIVPVELCAILARTYPHLVFRGRAPDWTHTGAEALLETLAAATCRPGAGPDSNAPRLKADPELVARYAAELEKYPRPWVGVAAGVPTPLLEQTVSRFSPASVFALPLLTGAPAPETAPPLPDGWIGPTGLGLVDFEHYAALLGSLDLLVTPDAQAATAGGAMQTPTVLALGGKTAPSRLFVGPSVQPWFGSLHRDDDCLALVERITVGVRG